ncbi:YddF family protein, partial [Candidatus Saccharibacteria bacterium]|nr:YddF family protein [Candidatus Saccharibacteria bacterium]
SAVGHESTAQVLTTLLGITVPMNRIQFRQAAGQVALVFKLNGRPEEGKVLTAEEIETIGYSFQKLTRTK